jgi:PAS domain S-box-containing protein
MSSVVSTAGVDLLAQLGTTLLIGPSGLGAEALTAAAGFVGGYAGADRAALCELVDPGAAPGELAWTGSVWYRPGTAEPSRLDWWLPAATRALETVHQNPEPDTVAVPLRAGEALLGVLVVAGMPTADGDRMADLTAAATLIGAGLAAGREVARAHAAAEATRGMLDDIGSVIVRVGADGRITYVNKAWTALTGISAQDIVGKDAMHHVHPDDRVLAAQHMAALIAGRGRSEEVRFLSAGGGTRWLEVTGHALFDDAGAVAGFAGVLHDVTDRRRAELVAHEARDRAEHAQRVAERANQAKNDFLSRMSHELRTPLNAIVGFSELLTGSDLAPEDAESVEQIVLAGRHLLDLVTEAIDVTRIESGQLPVRIVDLRVAELADECVGLMRPAAAERGLDLLSVPADRTTLRVRADPQRLRQVLLNLLSNAVKYSVPGGQINVDCYPLTLETPLGEARADGWLRICVIDTGIGIPADRLDDVFLPFERIGAESTGVQGTGLGLALTRSLVEAMGGQITVHSVPGVGTSFQVDLPAAPTDRTDRVPATGTATTGTTMTGHGDG